MRKTFVLLVRIRMYPYVSRMYPHVSRMTRMLVVYIRMYPYVTRMLPVCYPYVLVWRKGELAQFCGQSRG